MKRAALYARVSTGGQTVKNQLRELRAVAERLRWEVVEEFVDQGISGAKGRDKRPALDSMLKAVIRGEVDVVAAWLVDRLGRSLQDLVGVLSDIREREVDLYLHQQGLDTATPSGRAMFQMLGVFAEWLLSGFGVASIGLGDQACDEGAEERLAPATGVVDELEEAEIGRQLLLRDATVRPEPGTQQRPEALGRVDVDPAKAVAIVVAGILAVAMADGLVPVAPVLQAGIDVVLVGVHQGALGDAGLDHRSDRRLLDIGQHADHHLAATLQQAQDRRLLLRQRAAAGCSPQPPAAPGAPFLATAA